MTNCEFFLIRYVPDLIKNEPVNIGLVMLDSDGGNGFAGVRFASNFERVRCLDANADVEMIHALAEDIRQKLATAADRHEMLRIMQDFSNTLQISETRGCQTDSPQQEMEKLAEMYLESMPAIKEPRAVAARGRAALRRSMQRPFEDTGVWPLMQKNIAVSTYASSHDQLRIDCGYRPDGTFKMFHAVSLRTDPDYAKSLAFSYPRLAAGMARMEKLEARLTAVIENDLDRKSAPVAFAYEAFEESRIVVATLSEVPRLAELARKELRI